ncbi:hypothetical protein NQ318_022525 [Aromia moschata]|uniref:HTH psq-type domain-containing protein n=1 Tax=Aromia moschata TaxID=1265417 RepID=A0AAV8XKA3_9CUCU|nr:hypothetical protein NQ318_022525 [Aromia moschata]
MQACSSTADITAVKPGPTPATTAKGTSKPLPDSNNTGERPTQSSTTRRSRKKDTGRHRHWSAMENFDLAQAELAYQFTNVNKHEFRFVETLPGRPDNPPRHPPATQEEKGRTQDVGPPPPPPSAEQRGITPPHSPPHRSGHHHHHRPQAHQRPGSGSQRIEYSSTSNSAPGVEEFEALYRDVYASSPPNDEPLTDHVAHDVALYSLLLLEEVSDMTGHAYLSAPFRDHTVEGPSICRTSTQTINLRTTSAEISNAQQPISDSRQTTYPDDIAVPLVSKMKDIKDKHCAKFHQNRLNSFFANGTSRSKKGTYGERLKKLQHLSLAQLAKLRGKAIDRSSGSTAVKGSDFTIILGPAGYNETVLRKPRGEWLPEVEDVPGVATSSTAVTVRLSSSLYATGLRMRTYKRKTERANDASKEQLKNAAEAVQKYNKSIRGAAVEFSVDRMTLTRYLNKLKTQSGSNEVSTGYVWLWLLVAGRSGFFFCPGCSMESLSGSGKKDCIVKEAYDIWKTLQNCVHSPLPDSGNVGCSVDCSCWPDQAMSWSVQGERMTELIIDLEMSVCVGDIQVAEKSCAAHSVE